MKKECEKLPPRFRGACVIPVIKITVAEGQGTKDDPVRPVYYYHSLNGDLLAKADWLEADGMQQCQEA